MIEMPLLRPKRELSVGEKILDKFSPESFSIDDGEEFLENEIGDYLKENLEKVFNFIETDGFIKRKNLEKEKYEEFNGMKHGNSILNIIESYDKKYNEGKTIEVLLEYGLKIKDDIIYYNYVCPMIENYDILKNEHVLNKQIDLKIKQKKNNNIEIKNKP